MAMRPVRWKCEYCPTAPTTAEGEERRVLVADRAVGLPGPDQGQGVLDVLLGAAAQHLGEVAALDLEQREEVGVLGHEVDRRLGAPAQVPQRAVGRVEDGALLAAQAEADALGQLLEQRFLVVEVPVEEALGHAGGPDDVDDPGLGVAPLGEQLRGAVEQLLLALHALRGEPPVGFHRVSVPRA